MIFHYKLILQYQGTAYNGWQVQAENAGATVQGELNKALATISKSKEVRSLGAGRTDAGVHALGQVAKVSIPLSIDPDNLVKALNSHLPDDIRILSGEISDEEFFPTVHAKSKEYHYRFSCQRNPTAFQTHLITNQTFELDVEKMREACKVLVGEHDFTNFYCEGTEVSSYVREIFECEILEIPNQGFAMLPAHYVFRIQGSGFLKQMVRLLMGAVWNVGRGKITTHDLKAALSPQKIAKLGPTAPPQGLYMVRVNY